jgi:hypothetical protein
MGEVARLNVQVNNAVDAYHTIAEREGFVRLDLLNAMNHWSWDFLPPKLKRLIRHALEL